jgi:hypothetical protein
MSASRKMWLFLFTLYLGPVLFLVGSFLISMMIASIGNCTVSAQGVHPCVVAGHDFGEHLSGTVFFGYTIALFILPWLVIGALLLAAIRLLEVLNNQ